ncbi:class I SAM-dependent methyltransferase [Qipengyuania marisflavi]|uniref:class I SAM-dependent methyltransferase n=1 Tax=Qipengyuania marisflavi TaxID=2486356 RepID=UPI001486A774|nr:class I SAM-dependent methyltransferase [Qipengyuania marisflavi]
MPASTAQRIANPLVCRLKGAMPLRRIKHALTRMLSPYKIEVYDLLREAAARQSADYAAQHLDQAMIFRLREELWDYAASHAQLESGMMLEFGVFEGVSINHLAKRFPGERLYGFDSFTGLAEDWTGYHLPKGAFDLGGNLPKVSSNVALIKGWFEDTVPSFLAEHPDAPVRLCHLDCDTYASARYVLETIAPRLTTGSVIIFDEYYGYPNWQQGEFRAWQEVCKLAGLKYRYLAFANMQAAVIIE